MWQTMFGRGRTNPRARQTGHAFDSGTLPGAVNYMSPEQVRGLEVAGGSDIFSLRCILYEILTA
ncbi:MAG: hypothetical protein JSU86_02205 [Phycisphaerales bacterium]|nr:MAG: hypothetical protein JSU86_02205 [Phycisphaerales bacterium]